MLAVVFIVAYMFVFELWYICDSSKLTTFTGFYQEYHPAASDLLLSVAGPKLSLGWSIYFYLLGISACAFMNYRSKFYLEFSPRNCSSGHRPQALSRKKLLFIAKWDVTEACFKKAHQDYEASWKDGNTDFSFKEERLQGLQDRHYKCWRALNVLGKSLGSVWYQGGRLGLVLTSLAPRKENVIPAGYTWGHRLPTLPWAPTNPKRQLWKGWCVVSGTGLFF